MAVQLIFRDSFGCFMGSIRYFRYATKLSRYYVPTEFVALAIVEFLILVFSLYLALQLRFWNEDWQHDYGSFLPKAIVFALVLQLCLVAFGVYQRQTGRFLNMLVLRIASGLLLGMVPLSVSFYFVPTFFLDRSTLIFAVFFSFLFITLVRLFFRKVVKEHNVWTRVLVLGDGKKADVIRQAIKTGELKGVNIVSYMAVPIDNKAGNINTDVLGKPLVNYVEDLDIDEIVIAVDDQRFSAFPTKELIDCKMSGINVIELATFFERRALKLRLDMVNPSWLYLSEGFQVGALRAIGKRVVDSIVVLLLIPMALPLMLLVSLSILIESGGRGSILYSQTRVKQGGLLFKIYKFRSMVSDAEKDGVARWASKNDSRITRVGSVIRKVRLDELPQLFNILKGDMSFVGPRPERPEFVKELSDNIPYYEERHRVKPGLTGWAQVHYSYGDSEEDSIQKLQYDLFYVKNYSVILDILILLQTAEVVMLGKGAQ